MIIKIRQKPRPLLILEALIPRVRKGHPVMHQLKKDLLIRQKGYMGELKVDYYLEKLARRSTILHDVCLLVDDRFVQIDTIVITNFAIYCIEVKNMEGELFFNTTLRQFVQKIGSRKKAYRYPLNQVEHQKTQLKLWLYNNRLDDIPIYYLIAISEPSTIVNVEGDENEIAEIVSHAEYIPTMIYEKDKQLKRMKQATISHQKIGHMILADCKQYQRNIFQEYKLKKTDILPGVECPNCSVLSMVWKRRGWRCQRCQQWSTNAHFSALDDYFLLKNETITNKQARKFLNVPSRHTAYRLLKNANLVFDSNKNVWKK